MSFILKQFCDMCEEGFNHMKEMIPYHGFDFCSTKCVDKYKKFIRAFFERSPIDEGEPEYQLYRKRNPYPLETYVKQRIREFLNKAKALMEYWDIRDALIEELEGEE